LSFSKLRCWWLHRRLWTIVTPGVLPFHLDSERFCPVCNKMRGHPSRGRPAPAPGVRQWRTVRI
jgi:hypothetical protein